MSNINFTEIEKLHSLLTEEGIPHTLTRLWDGKQIRVYANSNLTHEFDDAVIHSFSHGVENGLLETFRLNDCEGWETAEQVFEGWKRMYENELDKLLKKRKERN